MEVMDQIMDHNKLSYLLIHNILMYKWSILVLIKDAHDKGELSWIIIRMLKVQHVV